MLDISFYILATDSAQERNLFTCKLVEKAYRQDIFSFILTESESHNSIMDDLLWTFRASSFIPHQRAAIENATPCKQILISADPNSVPSNATLINLSPRLPVSWNCCERILEVLYQNESILQAGRDRYRLYQQTGAKLTTHKL